MLSSFVLFSASLFLMFITGLAFSKIFNIAFLRTERICFRLFSILLFGLIILTIAYAVLITNGQTLLSCSILLFLFTIYQKWKKRIPVFNTPKIKFFKGSLVGKHNRFIYLTVVLVVCLIFIIQTSFFYSYSSRSYLIPYQDHLFYSKLASFLNLYNQENLLFGYNSCIPVADNGLTLYHYFDLWFSALLSRIFDVTPYSALYFLVYPILTSIAFIGILSLFEAAGVLSVKKVIIAFFFLFIGAVYFDFYKSFPYLKFTIPLITDTTSFTAFGRKLIIVFIIGLAAFHGFLAGDQRRGLIWLLFLTLVYSSGTLLGLTSGILLSFLFRIFKLPANSGGGLLAPTLSFFIFLYFFIWVNKVDNFSDGFLANSLLHSVQNGSFQTDFQSAVSITAKYALVFFVSYLIYLFIFFRDRKISFAHFSGGVGMYTSVLGFALLTGLGLLLFFFKHLDGRQLFTNLLPLLNILVIYGLILFVQAKRKDLKWRFALFVLLFSVGLLVRNVVVHQPDRQVFNLSYTPAFLNGVRAELERYPKNVRIAYRSAFIEDKTLFERPLFSNWSFLDFWGYTNLVNNSFFEPVQFLSANRPASCLASYIIREGHKKTHQLDYLLFEKIKIVAAVGQQKDIPENLVRRVFRNEFTNEYIYFLK